MHHTIEFVAQEHNIPLSTSQKVAGQMKDKFSICDDGTITTWTVDAFVAEVKRRAHDPNRSKGSSAVLHGHPEAASRGC